MSFEISPAGGGAWTAIATDPSEPYSTSLDTTAHPDGLDDLRAVATDAAGHLAVSERSGRTLDNTSPSVTLADPGALLMGLVSLAATASDNLAGVASVTFEVSPAGADTWTQVAADVSEPYGVGLDTTALPDGSYDLRAVATDAAGNSQTSLLTSPNTRT